MRKKIVRVNGSVAADIYAPIIDMAMVPVLILMVTDVNDFVSQKAL